MKIVILDGGVVDTAEAWHRAFDPFGEVEYHPTTEQSQAVELIGDAEVLIVSKVLITAEVMAQCPNLRYIGVMATGYNVIDLDYARAHGIPVTNIPAYSTPSVAQHVFALLLTLTNQTIAYDRHVRAGDWKRTKDFCLMAEELTELDGKKMTIFGFGEIGRRVARIALALGMEVSAVVRRADTAPMEGVTFLSRDEAFAQADVISLNCPLTEQTRHMINEETLAQMKPGAILLNTARGPLVDEAAVAAALKSGHLGAYGADVLEVEPMVSSPLEDAPRCIVTPHIAWASRDARARLLQTCVNNLRAWQNGESLNRVDSLK